jgi:hypothetical protein
MHRPFGSHEQIFGRNKQIPRPGQTYLNDIGLTVWENVPPSQSTPTVVVEARSEVVAGASFLPARFAPAHVSSIAGLRFAPDVTLAIPLCCTLARGCGQQVLSICG